MRFAIDMPCFGLELPSTDTQELSSLLHHLYTALFQFEHTHIHTNTQRKNKRRERMDQLFRKSNDINNSSNAEDDFDDVETRPIRRRDAVEAGLDYWMDDGDLERERQRRIAVKNRKVR